MEKINFQCADEIALIWAILAFDPFNFEDDYPISLSEARHWSLTKRESE